MAKKNVESDIAVMKNDIKYIRDGFDEFKSANRQELQEFKSEVRTGYITRDQMKSAAAVLLITFFVNLAGAYFIAKLLNTNEPVSTVSERSSVEIAQDRSI